MTVAQTAGNMSPGLLKVAQRAKSTSSAQFNSLAHLLDAERLRSAFKRLRAGAAVGVDGVTKAVYGEGLDQNVEDLVERLKAKRYRHQPIRRVHIEKEPGKTRPIGISTTEDKLVQTALRDVLEAIYEVDFFDCSYGFRPGRNAHDMLRGVLKSVDQGEVGWILEADLQSYFDSLDRTKLREMLRIRIADPSLLRVVGKCLHVGILDGAQYSEPEVGTAQGSTLSPLLGNIYLHYALDEWFANVLKPSMRGKSRLWRFADDFIMGFAKQEDAVRAMDALGQRMAEYGLTLHPEKTRLLEFRRPNIPRSPGRGTATFDLLGFTVHWKRTRRGNWVPRLRTRKARLHKAKKAVGDWCRRHRHRSIREQHAGLTRRLRGHYNYFAVQGNFQSLATIHERVKRDWYKWLRRRSQRARLNWERYTDLLRDFPLPRPRISVPLWT